MVLDRALGLAGFGTAAPSFPVGPPHYVRTIERSEYRYTIRTNDRGIRYRTVPLTKPAGTVRVVLVGDSFTEGACVAVDERWSDRVERALAEAGRGPIELINCGEAGTQPLDYGRALVGVGLDYQPDAVVFGVYFDDVAKTAADANPRDIFAAPVHGARRLLRALWPNLEALATAVRGRADRGGERGDDDAPLDLVAQARAAAAASGIDEPTFGRWLDSLSAEVIADVQARRIPPELVTHSLTRPLYFREGIGLETEHARACFAAMCRILDAMGDLCRERGIAVGVVLMPSVYQCDPAAAQRLTARLYASAGSPMRAEWTSSTTPLQHELSAWAAARGVPMLDLVPVFRAAVATAREPLHFAIDPHWTPAGHGVAAAAIRPWLESRLLR